MQTNIYMPNTIYREREEKEVFGALPWAEKALFSTVVIPCQDLLGKEADVFFNRLSMKLPEKWHRPYSQIVSFVKTRFAISLVRVKNRYFRGSRIQTGRIYHRVDWEGGVGLGFYSTTITLKLIRLCVVDCRLYRCIPPTSFIYFIEHFIYSFCLYIINNHHLIKSHISFCHIFL